MISCCLRTLSIVAGIVYVTSPLWPAAILWWILSA